VKKAVPEKHPVVVPSAVAAAAKFKSSKWDTLDEDTVRQQAVTSSKWDLLGTSGEHRKSPPATTGLVADYGDDGEDDDIDGV
jgi:hypothetical protein